LFALDVASKRISTIINLNEGLDFGNPRLGRRHDYLLTYEVISKQDGVSTVFAADLRNGQFEAIATLAQANVVGVPTYTGDDRAVIYTQVDLSTATTVSLRRQAVADDGITPVGNSTLWLADADYAAVYRRGNFVPTNAPPQVQIVTPTSGQRFDLPAQITVTAQAQDNDGAVAKVAFFVGSTMIAEDTSAPYSATFEVLDAATGSLLLTARATDVVGGVGDSQPVEVLIGVGAPVHIRPEWTPEGRIRLNVEGGDQGATLQLQGSVDLENWQDLVELQPTAGSAVHVDPESSAMPMRFYRVRVD
jgi:hypothetical protein